MSQSVEPILTENPNRFVLFPIEHDDIWAFLQEIGSMFLDSGRNRFSPGFVRLESQTK